MGPWRVYEWWACNAHASIFDDDDDDDDGGGGGVMESSDSMFCLHCLGLLCAQRDRFDQVVQTSLRGQ